jgi:hypothetical protein
MGCPRGWVRDHESQFAARRTRRAALCRDARLSDAEDLLDLRHRPAGPALIDREEQILLRSKLK